MAEEPRMPQQVSEENIGITQIEEDWRNLPDPRPPVSRWVFFFVGLAIIIAFAASGLWYYHVNVVPEKRFDRAVNYLNDGDYTGAYRLFEEVYEVKPKRKDVIFNLGRCLENMERYEAAANRYQEQLDKVPYHGSSMLRLGSLYISRLGRQQEGLALVRQGAETIDTPEAWEALVLAAKKLNNRDEIINALEKKAHAEKKAEDLSATASRLFALGAYDKALDIYEKAFDKDKKFQPAADGIKASRIKLGLPDSPEHTVIPGKALGVVKLGADKDDVKKLLGSPEKKTFAKQQQGNEEPKTVETWAYNLEKPDEFSVVFIKDEVTEAQTASADFKTEEGFGISTFADERFAGQLEKTAQPDSKITAYTPKDGGMAIETVANRKGKIISTTLRVFKKD